MLAKNDFIAARRAHFSITIVAVTLSPPMPPVRKEVVVY
jgi:hypothetical protein